MLNRKLIVTAVIGAMSLTGLTGCESLPGDKKIQGAVIGGAGGAAAGALVAKDNRLIGGLIGGALGAGGGYLIGTHLDKTDPKHRDDAVRAGKNAEAQPAKASDVKDSDTADLNRDGYVTLDEVVAMQDAKLSDSDMIRRLEKTGQVFELTEEQGSYLREHGVGKPVVVAMLEMNREIDRAADGGVERISRDRN